MMQTNTFIRWLMVAGMTVGLSIQMVGGEENPASKNLQLLNDPDLVVVKKSLPSVDPQLVPVSDDKPVTMARKESLYRPPQRGAPGGRVGGGTRGPSIELPLIWALVPDHVGLSTEGQPSLVWYLSRKTAHPLEFTVIDESGVTPLLETRLSAPAEAGIQIIRLADYDLTLEKGKTYQWSVSLISDPEHRSADIVAGGLIQVSDVPDTLGGDVRNANPIDATRLLAQAGFWYDAIGVISTHIQAKPSDPEMHALRASLLEEVNLNTPAQEDRQYGL